MHDQNFAASHYVEPDRVRREIYIDPQLFELEMERIHERIWIYCGHATQVPNGGDYCTFQIGRQPMVMIRRADGEISVLYNRCPHRGAMLCGNHQGNTGKFFKCSYHAWSFRHDGSLLSIPMIDSAYEGTNWGAGNPDCRMKAAARVESYRGFVFASLADEGPSLEEFLGKARIALDNMCDRSPEGEIEIVPNCFRVVQRSNWKIFIENQIDALHPAITHQSTGAAAREIELDLQKKYGEAPLSYHMLSAFATLTVEDWNAFETKGYPYGHTSVGGYMKLRPRDPESIEYERLLAKAYGKEKMEEILSVPIHHMMYYPGLGIQPQLQQLRVVRPLSVDRMLTEIWYFRLKGAPEAIHRRALDYYNLVNSPATMINADDMENFWKCQQGLGSNGNDWVSFHRHFGHDLERNGVMESPPDRGTSETPMRNQIQAWKKYMEG